MLIVDPAERDLLMKMAIGRIFLLGSRPTQPGDVETYEKCRALILELADVPPDHTPNFAFHRGQRAGSDENWR